ncbi:MULTISPECIES: NADPH-nitrite reductase [Bacillus]|uniref:Nitrite reductase [NAD(P)H] n=4 Tax=Bacillus subtilis group TaxID=653685 RepID=NASD_BACSU|nr:MULTISPECIES: NADPH-nitrite reductase [Bacillales]NP_388212.1 assimilatory nitrite reductase subunit [Bacillus subtilis subsp. subtilis str. 168]P42435.1 RecName: Full=Nitrite reductase [NAD(P)H] [Bacillus subtilis subsp. subtilis str. 168]CJR94445.1 pyridine nucleotide-disulfide oxidoreductase [Streptococcus pneumoniae]BAM49260.1 assimilatory nitrite reductase subunit [Bacillus subtilis BEST7613]AFQ56264.1 Assimilatory nitrite reductase subunit [Bacillus subtilis QB928]AGG59672.1 assimila
MGKKQLVLVGNGMAGVRAIEEILSVAKDEFQITIFGAEPHPNYNRILLSKVLQGDTDIKDITLNDWDWYEENNIQLYTNETVIKVDTENKTVITDADRIQPYDELILATGSVPFILPIPGADKKGVTAFRDIKDTDTMLAASKQYKKAAVIGGGLLGLEAARGLLNLGMDVSVIHLAPFLMERQLDATAGRLLQNELEKQGMTFLLEKQTEEIVGDDRVEGLRFKDGTSIEADLVVMAVGIRPNTTLGAESGIPVNRGIIVNDYMQTEIPHIYAVGECAEHRGIAYGLVAPLYEQAKVLAKHMCGIETKPYEGSVLSTQLKVSGVEVFSAGDFNESEEKKAIKVFDEQDGIYKKIVLRGNQIVGAVLFGDSSEGNRLFSMIQKEADISETSKISILQPLSQEAGTSITAAMSDDEIICGCNGVSKGAIIQAIQEKGCSSTDEIKACTGASRSCGGCKPLVEEILQHTLGSDFDASAQKEAICGCTTLSRDEVVEEIKAKGLSHTREVMNVLGWKTPEGCSKCRPALNYYLGMINPTKYEDDRTSRFVNERMHANIQKDGTYSVVPRMYGGVTNSTDLRKIADVVDKYEIPLVKMTGGQRIDLIGVKKEDLPKVWEDLDMPSGYAYGKTLRTVKTCVGEQFCRFGTQDSMALGIALEKKFEGLNTPHKVKMAVSACPRNCAESGIKDLGVVGIDGGWELYVGGNGGTHLRAGDLLMKVKTNEEVLEYAGAYLQYYRETANYLERTSAWLERVGLSHVQSVLNDPEKRQELNGRMNETLSVHKDPWKDFLEDKQTSKELFENVVTTS